MEQKRNVLILVYVAIGVIVIAGGFIWWRERPAPQASNPLQVLPNTELPPAMPAGIIIASDAQIVQSYTATTTAGKAQSTLIYTSDQGLSNLEIAYLKYLAVGEWTLQNPSVVTVPASESHPTTTSITISATKASSSLSVAVSSESTSTQMVNLNLLTP